jgi:hydroxymethylpyrimidine pyrophosphatase-like HAD family hydrolase
MLINEDFGKSKVYLSEHLIGLFSDSSPDSIKTAAHHLLVRDVEESIFREATRDYIEHHKFSGVYDAISSYRSINSDNKFMITSRHPYAEEAAKVFNADDAVTNSTIFKNGKFFGVKIPIRTAEDKIKATGDMLKRHDLNYRDCLFIGDGYHDIPLGEKCAVFAASPMANEKVKREADFIVKDYRKFANKLISIRGFQQEMPKAQSPLRLSSSSEIY